MSSEGGSSSGQGTTLRLMLDDAQLERAVPGPPATEVAMLPCMVAGLVGSSNVVNMGHASLPDGQALVALADKPTQLGERLAPLMVDAGFDTHHSRDEAHEVAAAQREGSGANRKILACR